MKLSDAMRRGARAYPKTNGKMFHRGANGSVEKCCALGAAYVTMYGEPEPTVSEQGAMTKLKESFPELASTSSVSAEVIRKNDTLNESVEAIASWLEARGY